MPQCMAKPNSTMVADADADTKGVRCEGLVLTAHQVGHGRMCRQALVQ